LKSREEADDVLHRLARIFTRQRARSARLPKLDRVFEKRAALLGHDRNLRAKTCDLGLDIRVDGIDPGFKWTGARVCAGRTTWIIAASEPRI
jgi:hypothetical protein